MGREVGQRIVAVPVEPGDFSDRLDPAAEPAASNEDDEIDGIGRRGEKNDYDDYWNSVVNKLLELIDGTMKSEGLIIVGATNRPGVIDPAIRRSGRLETHIEIPLPDVDALVGILAHHLRADLADLIATRQAPQPGEVVGDDTRIRSASAASSIAHRHETEAASADV